MSQPAETIFALASGGGPSGVAVLRLSGPKAGEMLTALTGRALPEPRKAVFAKLKHPKSGEVLDDGLVLWFPGPASFTGEDVAEFQIHGGKAVVAAFLETLAGFEGARLAEPGEFTRRAFDNGKMDLTEAEGLADLIHAETEAQRKQALRQMEGALGALYEGWRERLVHALAHQEAGIDFIEEEDIPEEITRAVGAAVESLKNDIANHLADGHRGERLRDGIRIAIIGPPNAGKSSLLNRLARREAAIVSNIAGTTRDVIEVHLDLGGFPVVVSDTAGLRESGDVIEEEGVRRAHRVAEEADIRVIVLDGAFWPRIDSATQQAMEKNDDSLIVINKWDIAEDKTTISSGFKASGTISAKTGEGLEAFLAHLTKLIGERWEQGATPWLTRERHREALEDSLAALNRYQNDGDEELAAEDLRLAARALGRITGRVDVEDLLDVIFSEFCIGK